MSWKWLESTRKLQEGSFGVKFPLTGDALADYVLMNHSAAVVELGEFMNEVQWKNWAQPRGRVNRDAAVKELVDVVHFIANLAVALDVTDAEWQARYEVKQEVNRQRQVAGYDGESTKCPSCRAALDDVGFTTTTELADAETRIICNACCGSLTQAHVDAVLKQADANHCPGCGAVYGAAETRCIRDGAGEFVGVPMPWCADVGDFLK